MASAFVYNVTLRTVCNRDDADEITQDVFIKIWKNLKSFHGLSSFKTWIYRITMNTAFNHIKAQKRHTERRADFDPAGRSLSVQEKARSSVDSRERGEKLAALLEELNPDQRACIVLREIEGLDYKEIAATLKININTVRSRLKRARESILSLKEKARWAT